MNMDLFYELVEEWRVTAAGLRRWGGELQGTTLDQVAEQLESCIHTWLHEKLPIARAAGESGYSKERLRELVRDNRIPDTRAPGSKGPIRIRRVDLPTRPKRAADCVDPAGDFASELVAARRRHRRHGR
jgi:hypothetical protein